MTRAVLNLTTNASSETLHLHIMRVVEGEDVPLKLAALITSTVMK